MTQRHEQPVPGGQLNVKYRRIFTPATTVADCDDGVHIVQFWTRMPALLVPAW